MTTARLAQVLVFAAAGAVTGCPAPAQSTRPQPDTTGPPGEVAAGRGHQQPMVMSHKLEHEGAFRFDPAVGQVRAGGADDRVALDRQPVPPDPDEVQREPDPDEPEPPSTDTEPEPPSTDTEPEPPSTEPPKTDPAIPKPASSMRELEKAIVAEINAMRRDPEGFVKDLQRFRNFYEGRLITLPDTDTPILSFEGVPAVDEAIAVAKKMKAVPELTVSSGLSRAAREHAQEQGEAGTIEHTGADGSFPHERMQRYGRLGGLSGENIGTGHDVGKWAVIDLFIDDGVSSRGHRDNLIEKKYRLIGVGCHEHTQWRIVCVMDFAAKYTENKR